VSWPEGSVRPRRFNAGIAGRRAAAAQVGAGTARAPLGCFTAALARARGAV
jgi:hypothetical protein